MRRIVLLLTLVLTINLLWSQNEEWYNYELDSIISIDLPGEVFELDTIVKGLGMYQMFSYTESSSFMVGRMHLEREDLDTNLSKLPYDSESLNKFYEEWFQGFIKSMSYQLKSKDSIEKENLKGLKLKFMDSSGNPTGEGEFYLVNKCLYSFYYISETGFDEKEKELFFNSINIDTDRKISQFTGNSQSSRIGYILGEFSFYIIMILIIFFVIKKNRRKPKYDELV